MLRSKTLKITNLFSDQSYHRLREKESFKLVKKEISFKLVTLANHTVAILEKVCNTFTSGIQRWLLTHTRSMSNHVTLRALQTKISQSWGPHGTTWWLMMRLLNPTIELLQLTMNQMTQLKWTIRRYSSLLTGLNMVMLISCARCQIYILLMLIICNLLIILNSTMMANPLTTNQLLRLSPKTLHKVAKENIDFSLKTSTENQLNQLNMFWTYKTNSDLLEPWIWKRMSWLQLLMSWLKMDKLP